MYKGGDMKETTIIIFIFVCVIAIFLMKGSCSKREGYLDPIYLNRAKYAYDYYPRANGSIYGFPYRYGGSWSIMSGYPYYDRAY